MKWLRSVVERIYPGAKDARLALEQSEAGVQKVDQLVADLRRLQQENHFSQALARTLEGR